MRLRKRMLDDLDLDIRDHLRRETQDNIERGMPPERRQKHSSGDTGKLTPAIAISLED